MYSEYAWNESDYTFLCVKSQISEVFDITEYNSNTKYADLAAALGTDGANIPESLRKGGMSVKYVSSVDHKYVQYNLREISFTTNVALWQEVGVYNVQNEVNKILGTTALYDLSYLTNGKILKWNGDVQDFDGYSASTEYLPLDDYDILDYTNLLNNISDAFIGLVLFAEDKSVVARFENSGKIDLSDYPTAKYFRFCCYTSNISSANVTLSYDEESLKDISAKINRLEDYVMIPFDGYTAAILFNADIPAHNTEYNYRNIQLHARYDKFLK